MARFNTTSIFGSVDLEDADSIRRIMNAMDYYLTNQVLNYAAPELKAIRGEERREELGVADTMLARIRMMPDYRLLLEATLRFVESKNGSDEQVLAAARELEMVATGEVLTSPQAYPEEYAAAEARFERGRAVQNYMPIHQFNRTLEQRVRKFLL
jgi:hypothetical protein